MNYKNTVFTTTILTILLILSSCQTTTQTNHQEQVKKPVDDSCVNVVEVYKPSNHSGDVPITIPLTELCDISNERCDPTIIVIETENDTELRINKVFNGTKYDCNPEEKPVNQTPTENVPL